MNPFPPAGILPTRRTVAFTLLELLVVISIIVVLAGLLLPVSSSVMENARKTEAKSTELQIVTAVKSFQTDYGVYPVPDGVAAPTTDTTYSSATNSTLFAILRNTDTSTTPPNSRHIVYFEGKDAKNANSPKSGFATQAATTTIGGTAFSIPAGTLVDPWGVGFMVRYDTGYDDIVMLPEIDMASPSTVSNTDSSGQTNGVLRTAVIAWSYGKDAKPGIDGSFGTAPNYTYGDDVVSWQ